MSIQSFKDELSIKLKKQTYRRLLVMIINDYYRLTCTFASFINYIVFIKFISKLI